MNEMINATRQPVVFTKDGEVFANSRDIAEAFDKNHRDVLASIDNLLKSLDAEKSAAGIRIFSLALFSDPTQPGRRFRSFDMNRDGFTLLAMGFTGAKALKWKLRYIEAFNIMEAELRNRPAVLPDLSDPVVLVQLLTEHATKRIEAEKRAAAAEQEVEAAKPKTVFYDQYANAEGLYTLQNAARVLGQGPNKFIGWLKQGYLFYQGGALVPKVQYREAGLFEVKATIVDDKARYQTYMTPRGVQHFSKKLGLGQLPLSGAA